MHLLSLRIFSNLTKVCVLKRNKYFIHSFIAIRPLTPWPTWYVYPPRKIATILIALILVSNSDSKLSDAILELVSIVFLVSQIIFAQLQFVLAAGFDLHPHDLDQDTHDNSI